MKKAVLFTILVIVVVLAVVGYVWYAITHPSVPEEREYTSYAPGGAKITEVDLASNPVVKLPPGFPESIPVEEAVVESLRKVYEKFGLVQYAVNSISERSFEAVWADYANFFEATGYVVSVEDKEDGVLEGERGAGKLTVYISPASPGSRVTLYYVEKK